MYIYIYISLYIYIYIYIYTHVPEKLQRRESSFDLKIPQKDAKGPRSPPHDALSIFSYDKDVGVVHGKLCMG